MPKQKKILVSFADSRLTRSMRRLEKQAKAMNVYDSIYIYNELDLDLHFLESFSLNTIHGSRGFGYWCWKPKVVLNTLNQVDYGDIIQWLDVGCWLNAKGKNRLIEYFELANKSTTGLLGFQVRNDFGIPSLDGFSIKERVWTKGDLFDYLNVRDDPNITETEQIETTSFFVKKTPTSVQIMEEWMQVWYENFALIDDSPSHSPDFIGFQENRHDQSVLSILFKKNKVPTVSAFEMYFPLVEKPNLLPMQYKYDWGALEKFPVWAKRDKDLGFMKRLHKKIHNTFASALSSATKIKIDKIW